MLEKTGPPERGGTDQSRWIEVGDMVKVRIADAERVWAEVKGLDVQGRMQVALRNHPISPGYAYGEEVSVVMQDVEGMLVWIPASEGIRH